MSDSLRIASPQPPCANDALRSELDAFIEENIERQTVVGASVLVARDGEIIYDRIAGWADRERKRPVERRTLFRLASMTKPVVSAAVLKLVELERLDLHAPVSDYLPWFCPKWNGERQRVTLHHLLTHTAGLGCGFAEPALGNPYVAAGVSDGLDIVPLTLEQNLKRLADVDLLSKPGTQWRYSLATDVLGAVLEAESGKSLGEVVSETVTKPLGMSRTAFSPVDADRLAVAYVDNRGGSGAAERMPDECMLNWNDGCEIRYAPQRAFDKRAYHSGGVGMIGDALDYFRFLEALRTGKFPSATMAHLMTGDRIPGLEINAPETGFGLGVSVRRTIASDGRSIGTWGWGGLYGTTFWVDPLRRIIAIVLTNTALEGMNGHFPVRVAEIVCSELDCTGAGDFVSGTQ